MDLFRSKQSHPYGKVIGFGMEQLFLDYNLSFGEIIGGRSDGGSDIKYWLGTALKEHSPLSIREWCIPHMLSRVAFSAFISANPDFKEVDDAVKALFHALNRSHDLHNLWDEIMQEKFKTTRCPTLGAEQRWLGCHRYYKLLVRFWPAFKDAFEQYEANSGGDFKDHWPRVEWHYQVILEHTALMKALLDLVVNAQGEKRIDGGEVLLQTIEARCDSFGSYEEQKIAVVSYDVNGVETVTNIPYLFLQPMTKKTIELVAAAMDTKYFIPRYRTWDETARRVI